MSTELREALEALRDSVVEMEHYTNVPPAESDPVWLGIRHRGADALIKADAALAAEQPDARPNPEWRPIRSLDDVRLANEQAGLKPLPIHEKSAQPDARTLALEVLVQRLSDALTDEGPDWSIEGLADLRRDVADALGAACPEWLIPFRSLHTGAQP